MENSHQQFEVHHRTIFHSYVKLLEGRWHIRAWRCLKPQSRVISLCGCFRAAHPGVLGSTWHDTELGLRDFQDRLSSPSHHRFTVCFKGGWIRLHARFSFANSRSIDVNSSVQSQSLFRLRRRRVLFPRGQVKHLWGWDLSDLRFDPYFQHHFNKNPTADPADPGEYRPAMLALSAVQGHPCGSAHGVGSSECQSGTLDSLVHHHYPYIYTFIHHMFRDS